MLGSDRRKFERSSCRVDMRIYTSIKKGSYSVKVSDISRNGAFIESKHLPLNGEMISFELIDSDSFVPFYMGNAKVCRVNADKSNEEHGYGVMFEKLLDEPLLDLMIN